MQIIAFTNDANKVSILSPSPNSGLTLEQIAQKDIPPLITYQEGEYIESPRPYLILDDSELPDRAKRDCWVIEGSSVIIDESMLLPAPIRTIDARRLRLALLQLDLLDTIESAISTLGKAAQIEWEFATDIKENYPLVDALATSLNLDTDAIFDLASSLT